MEEEKLLKYALYLLGIDNIKEAIKVLMVLVNSKDNGIKLQAIDALLSYLDQIKDHKVIITLCDIAIKISTMENQIDNLAYFQMRKAAALAMKIGGWKYLRKMFKLSPDWFNFSTEDDEQKYNEINDKIQKSEAVVDSLCVKSLNNAKTADNKKLLGMVYLYRSPIWKNRYSDLRIERMIRSVNLLPHCRLRDFMEYSSKDLKMINHYDRKAISDLKIAINIFKEVGDSDSVSYCLNNLSNHYLCSYRYIQAFIYLKKLKKNLIGTKDQELLRNFKTLKSRLFTRNRNIPDHVEEYKDYLSE